MSKIFHDLASGDLIQNWSSTGLITADDNWDGVASIEGYRGDELVAATGIDPATVTGTSTVLDVIANQTNPNGLSTGGVAEFDGIANPSIALNGSGTADAPYLVIYLNATGRENVRVQFNARDLDGSSDNSIQPIAVQYRTGGSGAWSNVPQGFLADATSGPSLATQITAVDVTLPAAANNQAQLEVRILTTNAAGNDEWVGLDDINV
ncbi:MAG TPA: endonuclease/exonuclease/phosphatase, partial [Alphaproteobacteria bacterium]|nr:endonuclease/exonuclease/phosphatase [Alphaproteobacteria bacterium]